MNMDSKNNTEYILCAANHYNDGIAHIHQPINIKTGYVICGQRHHNCTYTFALIASELPTVDYVKLSNSEIEGFLTSTNRFVNRVDAFEIAWEAGQLANYNSKNNGGINKLHSEDIY